MLYAYSIYKENVAVKLANSIAEKSITQYKHMLYAYNI